MKKVFLTGGSGFVGRAIVQELIKKGFEVKALVRPSYVPGHLRRPEIHPVFGDLWELDWLEKALEGVDFVVHAAATFSGAWEDFYRINVDATKQIYQSSQHRNVQKFIYISSVSIYPHSRWREFSCFREDDPYEEDSKASFYARSKIEAEKAIKDLAQKGNVPYVIFRPGAIYGPYGPLFPATMGLQIGPKKIMFIGNPRKALPLSYVENVARDVVYALDSEKVNNEIFNLVEDETLSRRDYLRFLKKKVNPEISSVRVPKSLMSAMKFGLRSAFSLIGMNAPMSNLNLDIYSKSFCYSNEKWRQIADDIEEVDFSTSLQHTADWFRQQLTPKRSSGLDGFNVVLPDKIKFNVGIVGCGGIANYHLRFLHRMGLVNRLYLADPDPAARDRFSKDYDVAGSFQDYRELLAKSKPDVVHILAPPQFHHDICLAAAEHGINVLVEKPMALDSHQAGEMVRVARDRGINMTVMHNHLFDRVMIEARRIMSEGSLGKIVFVESGYSVQYGSAVPPFPRGYWGYSLPGGLLQDFLPHAMYVALEFLSLPEVESVRAGSNGKIPYVNWDELIISLRSESQTVGDVHVSLSVSPRFQFLNVYGTGGSMFIDFLSKVILLDKEIGPLPKTLNRNLFSLKRSGQYLKSAVVNTITMPRVTEKIFDGSQRQIGLFYRSLALNESPPVSPEEALHVMKLMDEVWERMPQKSFQTTPSEKE